MLGRMNTRLVRTTALAALAASAALFAGGCSQQRDKELQALQTQVATVQQENDTLRTQLQQSEAQRTETSRQLAEAMAAKQAPQQQPPTPPPGGGGGGVDRPERDVVISVAGDVAFSAGQDTLTAAGRRELDGIARSLNGRYAGHRLRIEGYTDSDPLVKTKAKWGTNQALSLARARAVEKYLESRGVSGARMESVGRGSANPKSTKAASRRVEIHVLGK